MEISCRTKGSSTCDIMFPERFLGGILTWHFTVLWTIQEAAPFSNHLVFSGKAGREDPVSQMGGK